MHQILTTSSLSILLILGGAGCSESSAPLDPAQQDTTDADDSAMTSQASAEDLDAAAEAIRACVAATDQDQRPPSEAAQAFQGSIAVLLSDKKGRETLKSIADQHRTLAFNGEDLLAMVFGWNTYLPGADAPVANDRVRLIGVGASHFDVQWAFHGDGGQDSSEILGTNIESMTFGATTLKVTVSIEDSEDQTVSIPTTPRDSPGGWFKIELSTGKVIP